MQTTRPGQLTTTVIEGIPSGSPVGFQLQKAASGTVVLARTIVGVVERPAGTGTFVLTYAAPAEGDLYLVIADWNAGVLDDLTSKVLSLNVTMELEPGSSGLGAVADYAKMYMGGETWSGLLNSANYGIAYLAQAINVVKARVLTTPPDVADEGTLPAIVLNYLGILVCLQLLTAARDYWMSQAISITKADDASENVTYANRAKMMDDLRDDLNRLLPAAQAAAIPLIPDPVVNMITAAAMIDEDEDCAHVTEDPRDFPRRDTFPYHQRLPLQVWR